MRQWEKNGLRFGDGIPKICVPLTGHGMPALLSEIQQVADLPADLFEWRMDCFFGDPLDALPTCGRAWGANPLLCTLRTCREGGAAELSPEEYEGRLTRVIAAGGFWVCGHRALLRGGTGAAPGGPARQKRDGRGAVPARFPGHASPGGDCPPPWTA